MILEKAYITIELVFFQTSEAKKVISYVVKIMVGNFMIDHEHTSYKYTLHLHCHNESGFDRWTMELSKDITDPTAFSYNVYNPSVFGFCA